MNSMKISNILKTYDIYSTPKASSSAKTGKSGKERDTVALSTQAQDYQSISKVLSETPEVREDLVSELKAKIDSNSYSVSADDIASKLISKFAALE